MSTSIPAERRHLTVMFCDLVGSTELSARLDPEDFRDLILEYRQICTASIRQFDGHVARYFGDGLLVYFGYPQAHDDDALRAIRAGLAIIAAMRGLSQRMGERIASSLDVHIGVHTGEAVVGDLGEGVDREVSAAIGIAPNIAARLEQVALPGSLVISRDTWALVKEFFDFDPLGKLQLKGIADPFEAYRVAGERTDTDNAALLRAKTHTAMLGRSEELGFLLKQWSRAKEGFGQAQLISGEPGIGKSRLLHEFAMRAQGEPCDLMVCHCLPHYSNSAFYPFIDLLQRRLGFDRADTAEVLLAKLDARFRSGNLPLPEAQPLIASLLSVPSGKQRGIAESSSRLQREKTMEWLLAWIVGSIADKPLILMVEDIHWADASTIDLLTMILNHLATARVLLVMTFRPEFDVPWPIRSVIHHLTLGRLSSPHVRALLEMIAQGTALSQTVVEQVVARTDGVPLFVEEMTKMVMETGLLGERELLSDSPLHSGADAAIPASLRGSLAARLDRLGGAKSLAQIGAVLGREFSYGLLREVSGLDDKTLRKSLASLVDAELLFQRGVLPHRSYSFKHALIQDAAYASLLKTRRAEYHRKAAAVLVDTFPEVRDSHPEVIAHHYTEAGLNDQAAMYWHKAGVRAQERSADVEAITHLRKSLELLQAMPAGPRRTGQEVSSLITLGLALTASKGYGASDVEQTYARALALCERIDDKQQLFAALTGLHAFYQVRGPLRTAREIAQQLLDLARDGDDKLWLAQAHRRLGWCLFCLGRTRDAREHLSHAFALYEDVRAQDHTRVYGGHPLVIGFVNSALVEWVAGYPDSAVRRSREALALARELDRPLILAYAICMSAMVHQCRGEPGLTLQLTTEVIALSRQHGFPYWVAWGSVLQGWALAQTGSLDEGIARIAEGLRLYEDTGAELFIPSSLALLAESYRKAGRTSEALDALDKGLASANLLDGYFYTPELHRLKAEILIDQGGDPAAAEKCIRKAIALARDQDALSLELRGAISLYGLRNGPVDLDEARGSLKEVYGRFSEGFETADLRRARELLDA